MINPDPNMSQELFNDCVEHALGNPTSRTIDELMVDYWDEVSDAVLKCANDYHVTPQYVIEEWCVDSDFPSTQELYK